jgi:hypothetical protein
MAGAIAGNAAIDAALNELELSRRTLAQQYIKGIIFIVLMVIAGAVGFIFDYVIAGIAVAIGALIPAIIFLNKASRLNADYRAGFKESVIGVALSDINSTLRLQPNAGITEREFEDSQLYTKSPDRYHSEDFISGMDDKTSFYFAEVHAEYKTEHQTKNGKRTEWHDIFRGIIFCADFNKNFRGVTVVRPQDLGTKFGSWFSKNVFSFGDRDVVELENQSFQKNFVTYSSDQVEARYILTPALMDLICELNERCSETISLSFKDSRMYIAFPLQHNYFEPPVYSSLLKPDVLEKDISAIRFMYGIVKELDLNTRIWTKA